MKKIITYGHHTAKLHAGRHRAQLVTDEKTLPTMLADALSEAVGIYVYGLQKNNEGFGCIDLFHTLNHSDLIAGVCDAITAVHDTDITVSNARP